MHSDSPVKRALISVSDKSGLVEFARELAEHGIHLLSTGGTFRALSEAGLAVTEVADVTGFPEIMGGRVKTLHPKVHGALLARRGIDDEALARHDITPIDLLVVNLYPFEETIARPGCSDDEAIENIDIGGPAMLRAAAKNHARVCCVTRARDYEPVLAALRDHGGCIPASLRRDLAARAFEHTAAYDGAIANYLGARLEPQGPAASFGRSLNLQFEKIQDLRYGENPHQHAAFYRSPDAAGGDLARAEQLQGKALSYNNIADTDAALACVNSFDDCTCVIVKHANPCGVASGDSPKAAYERAFATDPESAFGGIIAFNRELDGDTAKAIISRQFVEVIIAPAISDTAREALAKKANLRALLCPPGEAAQASSIGPVELQCVSGGLLVQDRDLGSVPAEDLRVATRRAPAQSELGDLMFAWKVAKFVKSNAIVYARDGQTVGVGAGQMSRVNSARIALIKAEHAGLMVTGSAMASDAFFPFRDGIDNAAAAGISAVIQPGGSVRDEEVIAAADEHGIAMVFTGMRHFRH